MSDIFKEKINSAGNTNKEWTFGSGERFIVKNPGRDITTDNGVVTIRCFPLVGAKEATVITFPEKKYAPLMKSLSTHNSSTNNPVGKQEEPVKINVESFNPNKGTANYFKFLDKNYDPTISALKAHENGMNAEGTSNNKGDESNECAFRVGQEILSKEVTKANGETYKSETYRFIHVMYPRHSARIDKDCLPGCKDLEGMYQEAIDATNDETRKNSLRATKEGYSTYQEKSVIERGLHSYNDMRNNRKGIDPTEKTPMGFGIKITDLRSEACWNEDIPASQKISNGTRWAEFKARLFNGRVPTFHEVILDNLKIDASSENYEKVMGASLTEEEYNELGRQGVAEILYKKMNEITVKEFVKNFREFTTDESGDLQIVKKDVYDQSQSVFKVLGHLEAMTVNEKEGTDDNPCMVEIIPMMQFKTGSYSYDGFIENNDNWRGRIGKTQNGNPTESNYWVLDGAYQGQINNISKSFFLTGLHAGQKTYIERDPKTQWGKHFDAFKGYAPRGVEQPGGVPTPHSDTYPEIANAFNENADESVKNIEPDNESAPAPGM